MSGPIETATKKGTVVTWYIMHTTCINFFVIIITHINKTTTRNTFRICCYEHILFSMFLSYVTFKYH